MIEVECITTQILFHQYGIPYYLKIDIEGYDYLCIEAINENAGLPLYVSCESTSLNLVHTLYSKGYRKFKMINQADNLRPLNISKEKSWVFPIYLKIKNGILLRFQKYLPIKYPYSSSGPFGENTKGRWVSYEEMILMYQSFYGNGVRQEPVNQYSWFDFHAKID